MPGGAASDNVIATLTGRKYSEEYVVLGHIMILIQVVLTSPVPMIMPSVLQVSWRRYIEPLKSSILS